MTKKITPNQQIAAQISTNVNVGMDEVVNVFVSQYEDQLHEEKERLSKEVKANKKAIVDFDANLKSTYNQRTGQYETNNDVLGIKSTVTGVSIVTDKSQNSYRYTDVRFDQFVEIDVEVKSIDTTHDSFNKSFYIPLSNREVQDRKELKNIQDTSTADLANILGLIKSVSRKERQIRGKISEMKLKESGLESLLDNPDMIGLIQLN